MHVSWVELNKTFRISTVIDINGTSIFYEHFKNGLKHGEQTTITFIPPYIYKETKFFRDGLLHHDLHPAVVHWSDDEEYMQENEYWENGKKWEPRPTVTHEILDIIVMDGGNNL